MFEDINGKGGTSKVIR